MSDFPKRIADMDDPPRDLLELVRSTEPSQQIPPEVLRGARGSLPASGGSGGGNWMGPSLALTVVVALGAVSWAVVSSSAPAAPIPVEPTVSLDEEFAPSPVVTPPEVEHAQGHDVPSRHSVTSMGEGQPAPAAETSRTPDSLRDQALSRPPIRTGFLAVITFPYSIVRLNGNTIGTTPVPSHSVPVGTHSLRLTTEDGRVATTTVSVVAGETTRVIFRFEDRRRSTDPESAPLF